MLKDKADVFVIPGSRCGGTGQLCMVTLLIAETSKPIWDGGKLR